MRQLGSSRPFEVRLVSVPRMDQQGNYVGAFVILELLSLKNAANEIHNAIAETEDIDELFKRTYNAVAKVFDAECFFVSLLSKDRQHARVLYDNSGKEQITRWFPMSESLRRWNEQEDIIAIGDLQELLIEHDPALLKDPYAQEIIKAGLLSWLRYPVHDKGSVVATISIACQGKHRFSKEDETSLKALPLDKVLLKALALEDQKELRLVHTLTREVQGSRSQKEIAHHITRLLVEKYKWQNVSYFIADEDRKQFNLVAQAWDKDTGFQIPEGREQSLDAGILGLVYSSHRSIRITNVVEDEKYRDIFLRTHDATQSVLCVPVIHEEHFYGLLNLEHSQINAFSVDDQELLEDIAVEVGSVLERLSWHHMLNAAFDQVGDPVFFVDENDVIRHPNRTATEVLRLQDGQPLTAFGHSFEDASEAEQFISARSDVEYSGYFRIKGNIRLYATADKTRMPCEFPGFIVALKNFSTAKRERELEEVHKRFTSLAREVKTPLSLASSWLSRLHKILANDRDAQELVEKTMEQLVDIDVGYDKILYGDNKFSVTGAPNNFTARELIERVSAEFPNHFHTDFDVDIPDPELRIFGHERALTFGIKSILAFLTKFSHDEAHISVAVRSKDDSRVLIDLTEAPEQGSEKALPWVQVSSGGDSAEQGYYELAAGDPVIGEIIKLHDGAYRKRRNAAGYWSFQLEVPQAASTMRT